MWQILNHLHPATATLPFSVFILALGLEVWQRFHPNKDYSLLVSILLWSAFGGITLAFLTGYYAADTSNQSFEVPESDIIFHHRISRVTLILIGLSVGLNFIYTRAKTKSNLLNYAYVSLLWVTLGLLLFTGYLGGELVFRHGAGVRTSTSSPMQVN